MCVDPQPLTHHILTQTQPIISATQAQSIHQAIPTQTDLVHMNYPAHQITSPSPNPTSYLITDPSFTPQPIPDTLNRSSPVNDFMLTARQTFLTQFKPSKPATQKTSVKSGLKRPNIIRKPLSSRNSPVSDQELPQTQKKHGGPGERIGARIHKKAERRCYC